MLSRYVERLSLTLNVGGFFGRDNPIYLKSAAVRKIENELKKRDPDIVRVFSPPEAIWKVDCSKGKFKLEVEVEKRDGSIVPAFVTGTAFCRKGWWDIPASDRFAVLKDAEIEFI